MPHVLLCILLLCAIARPGLAQSETWTDVTPEASFVEPTFDEISTGPNGWIVGRAGRTLYASDDGGATWSALPEITQVPGPWLHAPALAPDGTIYVASWRSSTGPQHDIYRLAPDATTWQLASSGLPDQFAREIAVSPTTGTLLVSLNNSTFYRSTTQGDSWALVRSGLGDTVLFEHIAFADDGTVYIPQQNQIYESTDDGWTWSPVGDPLPFPGVQRIGVADDGTLYTCCINPTHALPAGETNWQPVSQEGLPDDHIENGFIVDIAVAGTVPIVDFYRDGLYVLGADGTWNSATDDLPTNDVATIALDSDDRLLASPVSGGLYRTAPAEPAWTLLPIDRVPPEFPALVTAPDGDVIASAGWGGLFRSSDGASWTQLPYDPTDTGPMRSLLATDGLLLASTRSGVLRSIDDGQSWTLVDGLPTHEAYHIGGTDALFASFVVPSAIPPYALYRSVDDGATWEQVPGEGAATYEFAVGWDGTVLTLDGMPLRSTDGGLTWTEAGSGIALDLGDYLEGLARGRTGEFFAPADDGTSTVFHTTNNGDSWTPCDFSPCGPPLLATPNLLYYSEWLFDEGFRIVRIDDEDTATPVGSFVFPRHTDRTRPNPLRAATLDEEGRLYAGLAYGLYRTEGTATPGEPTGATPRALRLDAAFPNPSTGTLTFAFSIAEPGRARLRVFDLLGRPVAVIADAPFTAQRHEVRWRARGLASGIYIAELETETGVVQRTFTLIR